MQELAYTLLPNLPENLQWVYGVMYIIMNITFFGLLLNPLIMIFKIGRKRY